MYLQTLNIALQIGLCEKKNYLSIYDLIFKEEATEWMADYLWIDCK